MRGQIVNRDGRLYVVVSYKDQVTGRWKKQWRAAGDSIRQAEKLRTKLLNNAENGVICKPGRLSFGNHLESWLKSPAIQTLAARTVENYEYQIRKYILPELSLIPIAGLTPTHVSRFEGKVLGTDGKRIRTVQMLHSILHKALDFALKEGLVVRNVVNAVDPPKSKRREMKVLTEKEIILVLALAKDTSFYPLLHLAIFTGLRRGELLGLRWGDVNPALATFSVQRGVSHIRYGVAKGKTVVKSPKTAKGKRQMPMSDSVVEVLRAHYEKTLEIRKALDLPLADTDYIFSSNYLGQPYDPCSTSRSWSRLAKKAGIKNIRFHDLRHTFATICLENNINPKVVSELLGHASTGITMDLYSHVSPTMQRDAVTKIDSFVFGSK